MFFLSVFLPVVILLYFLTGKRYRQHILLVASLFFYGWGEPKNIYIVLLVCLVSYICALAIQKVESPGKRRGILALDVILKLGVLGYFKYLNFLVENINHVFSAHFQVQHIVMPLGISFFIFQEIGRASCRERV